MLNEPIVSLSFLICTLNREMDLRRSILAICSAPNNEITFQIVVVDQGQSSAAAEICTEFDADYISSESRGLSCARNIGLTYCTGEFVALMDDDAYISDTYFEVISELIRKANKNRLGAFSGRIMTIENPLEPLSRYQGPRVQFVQLKNVDVVLSSALVIRRSIFCEVGDFDEDFGVGACWGGSEETDLLVRIINSGAFIEYFPSLKVYHPMSDFSMMSYKDTFNKTFTYGMGRGALLKKHKTIPRLFVLNAFVKPAGAFLVCFILFKPKDAVRYCSSFFGRLYGFIKYYRFNNN